MSTTPEWLNSVFAWLVRATWKASVLIVLVLLIQHSLQRVLSMWGRHALWLLVLIRLALLFSFESSISIFNLTPTLLGSPTLRMAMESPVALKSPIDSRRGISTLSPVQGPPAIEMGTATKQPHMVSAESANRRSKSRFDWWALFSELSYLWLAGVLLMMTWLLGANARLASRLRHRRPLSDLAVLRMVEVASGDQAG